MDLMALVQGFMAKKQASLCEDLAKKYGVPREEIAPAVNSFLEQTYTPAGRLADDICRMDKMVLLFIGRKDCAICQRSKPILHDFLVAHNDLVLVDHDYSQPQGLLYHIIHTQEKGMLPLIAFICKGDIKMIFTGECLCPDAYEKHYYDMKAECCQNLYVR
ncbi:MAG TPA: hypothetical protein PKK11_00155 [Methanothrix sp.]|nr:hypothetical protein [Methanothrix sp.]HPT20004.1 hypothetical protein [Methanothrix sp.]